MSSPPAQTTGPPPGHPLFERWGRLVVRHRVLAIVATVIVSTVFGVAAARGLRADSSDEHFLAADADTTRVLQEVRRDFGNDLLFQVLVQGDVFSLDYLSRLKKLHDELSHLDIELLPPPNAPTPLGDDAPPASSSQAVDDFGDFDTVGENDWGTEAGGTIVDEVISLINVRETRSVLGGIRVEGLLDRWPTAEQLPALRQRVLGNRTLVGQVIDREGTHAVVVVRTRRLEEKNLDRVFREVERISAAHEAPGFHVLVGGGPAVSASLREMLVNDSLATFALSSLVMLVMTAFFFRHPIGILNPFLVIWQAETWTVGMMALTDTPMTLVTAILPAFIGAVGLGDTIHIQSVYRSKRALGIPNEDAIIQAVASTGMPVLLTTLTTAVGLASFRLASLSAIQEMGVFGAFGVIAALVNSLVFLPALLTLNKKSLLGLRPASEGSNRVDVALRFMAQLGATRVVDGVTRNTGRNAVLASVTVLTVLAAIGISRVEVRHDGLRWFPHEHPTRIAVDALEASVGGTANMALVIEAREGHSLRDRETLQGLEKLERHLLDYTDAGGPGDAVRNVTSVLDPVRESWRAVHDGEAAYYAVPDTDQGVNDMFTLFENAAPDPLRRLITVDLSRTLLTVRVKWRDAGGYMPIIERMTDGVERFLGDRVVARATGSAYVAVTIVSGLLMDLLRSFGTAVVVITVLMVFLLRDIKLGLLAMLPNLLPVLIVMAFMGYVDIYLDTSTLMIGSVAIGIVVDDTIHFLHPFRVHHRAYGDVEDAIEHAFLHSGRAMLVTSVLLCGGCLALATAQLLSSQLFGLLVALTVVVALAIDFTFTPALLRLAFRTRDNQGGAGKPEPVVLAHSSRVA